MASFVATHCAHGKRARRPSGVIKLHASSSTKPRFQLRSLDKFFWYTAADGITRLATSSDTPGVVPLQTNAYTFAPSQFAHQPYPSTFPLGGIWPPEELRDLVCAVGNEYADCVGDECYTDTICADAFCHHTLENWQKATQGWQDYFELRMTESRGVGVFTKQAFKEGHVLGWYAGELKTLDDCNEGDYVMEIEIGEIPAFDEPTEATVFIDGATRGNWTRFINHSCDAYAVFRVRRVGNIRIMGVEAVKDVPEGVELTVNYGDEYYGLQTKKICCCGAENCVGKGRRARGARIKKCRRRNPPDV
ncbi:SET domain-containing protein [Trematosphaeria pertusa]|uniref:SET domain-containing protein n=1 Tax=Trematosphaeria pertusa TaxID=390896 RepID=A0A6A6IW23_9PLEO|nr:SET domain-containing protein [Trematosphaeria pertusa]KAF2254132.1 SET domain-containing protein [Trematosphaeria pertusa]